VPRLLIGEPFVFMAYGPQITRYSDIVHVRDINRRAQIWLDLVGLHHEEGSRRSGGWTLQKGDSDDANVLNIVPGGCRKVWGENSSKWEIAFW
jgi:hypothetical protein